MESLKYTDETDRCFGAAGMAISLIVYDGEEMMAGFSIDPEDNAPASRTIILSPEFYFSGSPTVSASSAWHRILKNYSLALAMAVGNVMCRHLVGHRTPLPAAITDSLRELALAEGADSCQLDADEAEAIFNKTSSHLSRVFAHRGVQSVAHDFASALQSRRSLSRLEALELLQALRML